MSKQLNNNVLVCVNDIEKLAKPRTVLLMCSNLTYYEHFKTNDTITKGLKKISEYHRASFQASTLISSGFTHRTSIAGGSSDDTHSSFRTSSTRIL